MKRSAIVLLVLLTVFSLNAAIEQGWSVRETDVDWLEAEGDTTRGASFNPDTGNVIVVTRAPEPAVKVLDGSTGDLIKNLTEPVDGYSGELAINKVKVSQDGMIFVSNLTENGSDPVVYIWEGESDSDPVAYSAQDTGNRVGDQIALAEDDDFIYYIIGSHKPFDENNLQNNFLKLTYDTSNSTVTDELIPFEVRSYESPLYSLDYDLENDMLYGTAGTWNPRMEFYHNVDGTYEYQHRTVSFEGNQSALSNLYGTGNHELVVRAPMHVWAPEDIYLRGFIDKKAGGTPGADYLELADFPLSTHSNDFNSNNTYHGYEVELFDLDEDHYGLMVMVTNNFVEMYTISKEAVQETIDAHFSIEELWAVRDTDVDWLEEEGDETRGASFNPDTGNVIVATRPPVPAVKVLNGTTGEVMKELDEPAGGYSGGDFEISKVKVSQDGMIFISNLTTDGSEATVYIWDSEEDTDPEVYTPQNPGNRVGDQVAIAEDEDNIFFIIATHLDFAEDNVVQNYLKIIYDKTDNTITDELIPFEINHWITEDENEWEARRLYSLNYDLKNDMLYGTGGWWNPHLDFYHNVNGTYEFLHATDSVGGNQSALTNLFPLQMKGLGEYALIARAPMQEWAAEDIYLHAFIDGHPKNIPGAEFTELASGDFSTDPNTVFNYNGNYAYEVELFELDENNIGILLMITNNVVGMYTVSKDAVLSVLDDEVPTFSPYWNLFE